MEGPIKKFLHLYVFYQNELEEFSEAASSAFQIDQEDASEKGASETESMSFKPQETSEIQPADESSKLLEDERPAPDSKAAKWVSLKVKHYLC